MLIECSVYKCRITVACYQDREAVPVNSNYVNHARAP
jgi:hypothetical protein